MRWYGTWWRGRGEDCPTLAYSRFFKNVGSPPISSQEPVIGAIMALCYAGGFRT